MTAQQRQQQPEGQIIANIVVVTSAALFAASGAWYMTNIRRVKLNAKGSDALQNGSHADKGSVGSRGIMALAPPVPYLDAVMKCFHDPYDPKQNPRGHIALCVAENKLIIRSFSRRLLQPSVAQDAFSDPIAFCYNATLGLEPARNAVAHLLTRKFLLPHDDGMKHAEMGVVDPEHVALASGCASLLNTLFYALAEEGDAVLIPAPYYAAFENDMKVVAKCVPFPVLQSDPTLGPTIHDLETAKRDAEEQGLTVKILLLTNPNNPLGVIYSPNVVLDCVAWSRSNSMHTIVDEIYGLSVHDNDNNPFKSVISILDNRLGNDVHFLWAMSKDFGSSGFRIGILYTQNEMLLRAIANLNVFSSVSHPMQMVLSNILTDDEFVDSFLNESRVLLKNSYSICTEAMDEMNIPYIPANSGIFVYCDFSSLLPPSSPEGGEAKFANLVRDHARVVMTPGMSQRDNKQGMFRICYAWNSVETLSIAMKRIGRLVHKIRTIGWETLELNTLLLNDIIEVE